MKRTGIFRVLNIIKNVVCWTLIVCLVSVVIIFFMARTRGETPAIFGYSILRVSSGSMEPELMVGDVILDKKPDNFSDIKKGDVVTFNGSGNLSGMLVTHKVIKAPYYENGVLMLQTRGIANEIADEPILATAVTGIMVFKIPYLDTVYNIFLSPWGLLILIGLVILVFIDEVVVIIKILTGNDKSVDDGEDVNEIIERLQNEAGLKKVEREVQSKIIDDTKSEEHDK